MLAAQAWAGGYPDHHTTLSHLLSKKKKKASATLPRDRKLLRVLAFLFLVRRQCVLGGGEDYARTRSWRGETEWSV